LLKKDEHIVCLNEVSGQNENYLAKIMLGFRNMEASKMNGKY